MTPSAVPSHAIVLFSHGSRDPLWSAPLRAVEEQIRRDRPEQAVCSAYLELCLPDLPTAVRQMLDHGHQHIVIVPMFLGIGKHAREDLPLLVEQLRAEHPQAVFHLQPAIGEDLRMTRLMADIACSPPTGRPETPAL
ncbi:CbiX/SirB N-terminal domain-containing protein [Acidovorax lacteus]|uniref:Cobalamin biosynthesis protein CbiX n=1 Tax=Acidovorax lacteus TaxID=1924988 RepID=A0ABP8L369_9BURK